MYQALYRKYRPMKFSDVSGQEPISTTLKNEITQGKIAHAYLFCGGRGTGKTTCARIFAKAINCLNPKDGEPCNECEICRQINDGSLLDVIEIDGASNTGVDSVRDIRDEVVYTPSQARYKVYIIDEVHMLSTGAFNALLKTLEDPPGHVIFILATTDPNKILPTVISRCQRFDFKRISVFDIKERLRYITGCEGLSAEDGALELIARLGDGAMRDAISLLDQCVGSGKELSLSNVQQILGVLPQEAYAKLLAAVADGDTQRAIEALAGLRGGANPNLVCAGLIDQLRDLMLLGAMKNPDPYLLCGPEGKQVLLPLAKRFTGGQLLAATQVLQKTLSGLPYAHNGWILLEMAMFQLCDARLLEDNQALLARLSALETRLNRLEQGGVRPPAAAPVARQEQPTPQLQTAPASGPMEEPKRELPAQERSEPVENAGNQMLDCWPEILEELKGALDFSFVSLLLGSNARRQGNELVVVTDNPITPLRFAAQEPKTALLQCAGRFCEGLTKISFCKKGAGDKAATPDEDPFLKLLFNNKDTITIKEDGGNKQ